MSVSLSYLLGEVLEAAQDAIGPYGARKEFYKRVIEAFEESDLDLSEVINDTDDKALKAAVLELHPDWEF